MLIDPKFDFSTAWAYPSWYVWRSKAAAMLTRSSLDDIVNLLIKTRLRVFDRDFITNAVPVLLQGNEDTLSSLLLMIIESDWREGRQIPGFACAFSGFAGGSAIINSVIMRFAKRAKVKQ